MATQPDDLSLRVDRLERIAERMDALIARHDEDLREMRAEMREMRGVFRDLYHVLADMPRKRTIWAAVVTGSTLNVAVLTLVVAVLAYLGTLPRP